MFYNMKLCNLLKKMCYKELLIFLKESTSSIEEDQNKVGILNQSKDGHDDSLIEAGNIAV